MKDELGFDKWQCGCGKYRYRFQIACPCGKKLTEEEIEKNYKNGLDLLEKLNDNVD